MPDPAPTPMAVMLPPLGYDAANCPRCGAETKVYCRRQFREEMWPRRYRECKECGLRFTTVELYVEQFGPRSSPDYQAVLARPDVEDPFDPGGETE